MYIKFYHEIKEKIPFFIATAFGKAQFDFFDAARAKAILKNKYKIHHKQSNKHRRV